MRKYFEILRDLDVERRAHLDDYHKEGIDLKTVILLVAAGVVAVLIAVNLINPPIYAEPAFPPSSERNPYM